MTFLAQYGIKIWGQKKFLQIFTILTFVSLCYHTLCKIFSKKGLYFEKKLCKVFGPIWGKNVGQEKTNIHYCYICLLTVSYNYAKFQKHSNVDSEKKDIKGLGHNLSCKSPI